MLLNISPRLGFNRSVPPAAQVFETAEKRWHDWFAARRSARALSGAILLCWWVMRSGLISPRYYMTREGLTPSKIHMWACGSGMLSFMHWPIGI